MAKNKYKDLDKDFKDRMAGAKDEDLDKAIRDAALYEEALLLARENDQDLAKKAFASSEAAKVYNDGKKQCRLKIAYCREVLKSRGRQLPGDVADPKKKEIELDTDELQESIDNKDSE